MERTIRVTGKGKIAVKPDTIRLMMDMSGIQETYEKAMELSTKQTEALRECFHNLGFDKSELKTLSFGINTKYEGYEAEDKSWKNRFAGYEFKHSMKIEFASDNDLLGKVLYALAHESVAPEFRIVYTIKDVEASKNLLLGKAVLDSKEKAKVLAEAAGVSLGEIVMINYSWDEIEFVSSPMQRMMKPMVAECCTTNSYDINIEADDIEVSDTVTVIWSIQ